MQGFFEQKVSIRLSPPRNKILTSADQIVPYSWGAFSPATNWRRIFRQKSD
jgi:hypothetical protein